MINTKTNLSLEKLTTARSERVSFRTRTNFSGRFCLSKSKRRFIMKSAAVKHQSSPNRFAYRVIEDSMAPIIVRNDKVAVDMNEQISDGNIVIVKLKGGRQLVRRYSELHENKVILNPENSNYEPVIVGRNEIEAISRVIGVFKDVKPIEENL